jgi:double-stranded uracil-DNA glycosylase
MDRTTVEVYGARAAEFDQARPIRTARMASAKAFANAVTAGGLRADLGCGPGRYAPALGSPLVALDAAWPMLELTRYRAPGALLVQADLEALPFARHTLRGAFAANSYLHLPSARLPVALAQLHRSLCEGAPLVATMLIGSYEGRDLEGDDFPGRYFTLWDRRTLADVVVGAGFEISRMDAGRAGHGGARRLVLRAYRSRTLPDTVGPDMRVLVCGLNPSLYAADAGIPFARRGNRFWPAAVAAGLVTKGWDPDAALADCGVGMTDLVKRASRSASELGPSEYREGAARLERLVAWLGPRVVCVVGLTGWRAAIDPRAQPGRQPSPLAGVPVYVVPSSSGRNAHVTFDDLVSRLQAVRALAS